MNPVIGRGVGLLGALLLLISPFLDLGDFGSLWDIYERVDVLVLLSAIAAGALIVLDLVMRKALLLLIAAGIGLVVFGIYLPFLIESGGGGIGAFLGTLGAVLVVVGSVLGYIAGPMPVAAPAAAAYAPVAPAPAPAQPAQPAQPAPQPAQPAPAPEPAASLPPAGWYSDPSGQARLRYWDGQAWTEQTSA